MASGLAHESLNFKDCDGDGWQITWYSRLSRDKTWTRCFFKIEELEGKEYREEIKYIELQNNPSIKAYLKNPKEPETLTAPATTQETCWLWIGAREEMLDILLPPKEAINLRKWIIEFSEADGMNDDMSKHLKKHKDTECEATTFEACAWNREKDVHEQNWINAHQHLFNAAKKLNVNAYLDFTASNPYTIQYGSK